MTTNETETTLKEEIDEKNTTKAYNLDEIQKIYLSYYHISSNLEAR